ncbi:MAG: hypothetical protein SXV54_06685 [Chloroflexota bacterium]|nr:hypothetical protein [Chloroflexota bacterium]
MTGDKQTIRTCKRDGFPLVKINGRWECVAEYLDYCIGGQRIVDLVQCDEKFYYVFENGHELPLFCFCCDEALVIKNLRKERRYIRRRRLESMSVGPVPLKDGTEMLQFCLELSKKGIQPSGIAVPISTKSAVQMHHPPGCPRSTPALKQSTDHSTKRRRKRKR